VELATVGEPDTVETVAHHHRRFAILDVTFAGQPLPGATVDCWVDDSGQARWIARVVARQGPTADEGELSGRTSRGGVISGQVRVVQRQAGPSGRRETLCEFHGSGELTGLTDLLT
jgi:hypothetical protein